MRLDLSKSPKLTAFVLGLLLALALPPFYIFPLAFVAFSLILKLYDNTKNKKEAFKIGYWFGFGYFLLGLYWISAALLIDIKQFGWMIPFALFGIAAVVAVYIGLVFYLLSYFKAKGFLKILIFAALWTLVEVLRGILFTGFPWNLVGYIWSFSDSVIQTASVVGIWGLSFITVVTSSIFYLKLTSDISAKKSNLFIAGTLGFFCIINSFGYFRLYSHSTEFVPGVNLRIVQANIKQDLKWDEGEVFNNFNKQVDLSLSSGYQDITHIIWPESAIPYSLDENSNLLSVLKDIVPKNGLLISGAVRREQSHDPLFPDISRNIWNSVLILGRNNKAEFYNKNHLVPFGEYIPFRNLLPLPINKITGGMLDFSVGGSKKIFNADNFVKFAPIICYEVIFPDGIVDSKERPQVLINVTNDAWYGYSTGPFQHFQMARMRSVEQGIPLIRAANTGISGVVDAYGRVIKKSNLEEEIVIDSKLPVALSVKTMYAYIGAIGVVMPLLFFLFVFYYKLR